MGGWRERLQAAVDKDGRSLRRISLAAGLSEAYLFSLLRKGKEPSISNLQALGHVLDVSTIYLIEGIELSADAERLLKAWSSLPIERRAALLRFLTSE